MGGYFLQGICLIPTPNKFFKLHAFHNNVSSIFEYLRNNFTYFGVSLNDFSKAICYTPLLETLQLQGWTGHKQIDLIFTTANKIQHWQAALLIIAMNFTLNFQFSEFVDHAVEWHSPRFACREEVFYFEHKREKGTASSRHVGVKKRGSSSSCLVRKTRQQWVFSCTGLIER